MACDDHAWPSAHHEHRELPLGLDSAEQVEEQVREILARVESGEFTASAGLVQRLEGILIALQALKEQ